MEIGNYTNADLIQKIFELICSWYVIFCQEIILLGKNLIFLLYYVTERNIATFLENYFSKYNRNYSISYFLSLLRENKI